MWRPRMSAARRRVPRSRALKFGSMMCSFGDDAVATGGDAWRRPSAWLSDLPVHCQVKKLSGPPVLGWAFEFADEMAKGPRTPMSRCPGPLCGHGGEPALLRCYRLRCGVLARRQRHCSDSTVSRSSVSSSQMRAPALKTRRTRPARLVASRGRRARIVFSATGPQDSKRSALPAALTM